jgi:hypothetical protein
LEIALIFIVFFIVGGAPVPHVNETHYLTKAKHYWDASYCPGDFFLDSADPHLVFYWTFGWLTRLARLPVVAWIGRVVAWALLAFAWERLARAVTDAPWASVLSAALWVTLVELGNFAGEWVVGGVEAKCFAYALVLAGLAAMCRADWRTPWIWFGGAAAFHVLVGAWAVLAAFFVWLTERRELRGSLKSLIPGLILGGLLSLPGLLPALALDRGADPETAAEAARIYVFERLPHHLAPLSLPAEELARRLDRFRLVALTFLLLWAWTMFDTRNANARSRSATEPASAVALSRIMRFAAFALLASLGGLAIEAALADKPLTAARILRYYWFRQADVAVPLAVALGGTQLVVTRIRQRAAPAVVAALVPLIGCGWFLMTTAVERFRDPKPPAAARLVRMSEWQDACTWIREHAPAEARFLIPRVGHSFKWYAARADVANYKDVPQDAASVVQWRRRCSDVFPVEEVEGLRVTLAFPDQLGTKRVRALAQKYGASHVLARSYPPLDLKVVYPAKENAGSSYYTVYETGVAPSAKTP